MKFSYTKRAQAATLKLLKHVETLSFACAIGGPFTDDARQMALFAACVYVVANLLAILIECIVVDEPSVKTRRVPTTRRRSKELPNDDAKKGD